MICRLVVLVCVVFFSVANVIGENLCGEKELVNIESDSLVFGTLFEELSFENEKGGKVTFTNDERIKQLIELHRKLSFSKKGFSGYRIQIYSESSVDTDIKNSEQYKVTFEQEFPGVKVYLKYFDPDFKIRVGNFRSKLECMSFLKRIKSKYTNSYPVKTFIYYNELKKEEIKTE